MKQQNRSSRKTSIRIPVTLASGINVLVDPSSIPSKNWTDHHGTSANGTEVESLSSTKIPGSDSMLLDNGSVMLRASEPEMEVFCTQYLKNSGFSVTQQQES